MTMDPRSTARKMLLTVTLASLTGWGCYSVAPAPRPLAFAVQGPPSTAIAIAVRELVASGFEISHSDPVAGVVQARRERGPHGNDGLIQFAHHPSSVLAGNLRSTVAVSVSATARADSSLVTIATVITAAYPSLTGVLSTAANEEDCITNGTTERAVAAAVSGRR